MSTIEHDRRSFSGVAFGTTGLVIFWLLSPIYGQKADRETTVNIASARAFESVFVDVTVHTSDIPLFIPICGTVMGEDILCYGTALVEVQTKQGWRPMASKSGRTIGYHNPATAEHRILPPRSEARFSLQFAKDLFQVERGQRVRLVIKAWPDRETMINTWQNPESAIRLITSEFEFP